MSLTEPDGSLVAGDPLIAGDAVATQEVVVLDYGGQYSQLIARRVRECGVFSTLLPHHVGPEEVARRKPIGLILSGGPASVYADGAPKLDPGLLELGIPVLGICYGMQLIARELGGDVEGADVGEYGRSQLTVHSHGRLLADTPDEQACWMSHRDTVFAAPPGFDALASSSASPVAAIESPERAVYGIQFHPEVVHTPYGQQVLRNFLIDICGAEGTWSARSVIEEQIESIREQVGDGHALCALSGGVDSSVAALLVHRAIGDRLTCVFVDHGLMRKNEGEQVVAAFRDHFHVPLIAVDAEERYPSQAEGRHRPRAEAQDHRHRVHPHLRGGGREARRHPLPGAGHALLGRDRVRRRHRHRHDQVTPQRRRSSRGPGVRAGGAACARSSKMRCGRSAPSSACPSAWSGDSHSPGPA